MRSRHKRHLRLLESLRRMGWFVEMCYVNHLRDAAVGTTNTLYGRHLFWRLTDSECLRAPTSAPPFRNAGNDLRFVVVSATGARRAPFVALGWKSLARFARDRFEEGK